MTKKPLQTALPELDQRAKELLGAVVREYIATAEPVASAQLVRRYRLEVSAATVRNELAALEDAGLLTHPHTSAGRVPTDLGYRYFIESLMPRATLRHEEQVTVSHQFQQSLRDTAEWLRLAASTLARLTAEASIVTTPAAKRTALRHVEVVPISERRVLLVAVLDGGAVRQQVVELGTPSTPEQLRALSGRLTATLAGAGATNARALAESERGADADVVRALVRMLEAIRPLGLGDGEVRVAIGSEHHLEPLRDCSLVVGRYGQDSDVVGFVGVVGPTRMDYARSIGAVRYVGSLMGDLVRVMEGQ